MTQRGKGGPAAGQAQRAFCAVRISFAMSSSLRALASAMEGRAICGTVRATSVRIETDWPTMVAGALNEAAAAKRESMILDRETAAPGEEYRADEVSGSTKRNRRTEINLVTNLLSY